MALQPFCQVPGPRGFYVGTWKASSSVDFMRLRRKAARKADRAIENELEHMYDDWDVHEILYPAATKVREEIDIESWSNVENYRWCVIDFSLWMRRLELDEGRRIRESSLDLYFPIMQDYILQTWGKSIEEKFLRLHHDLVHMECVVDDEQHGGGEVHVQVGDPAKNIQEMFRHHPLLWFIYNLYFPADVRMSWSQLMEWAIVTLQKDPMEPPSWTTKLLENEQVLKQPQTANEIAERLILDQASVEIFTDLETKFEPRRFMPPPPESPHINDDYLGNGGQQSQ